MRRIVSDTDDPVEAGKRFQEMVKAGIERFNEGSLPQAVAMLELAEKLITEKKVDRGSAEIVKRKLGETLDDEQLKKVAELPGAARAAANRLALLHDSHARGAPR